VKLSVGNDIVEHSRIEKIFQRYEKRFLEKIFTKGEIDYCLSRAETVACIAARFALKEAVIKALAHDRSFNWKDIELHGISGKKDVILSGKAKELLHQKGFSAITASISHGKDYSTAVAVVYGE